MKGDVIIFVVLILYFFSFFIVNNCIRNVIDSEIVKP